MTAFLIGLAIGCLVGYLVRDQMPSKRPPTVKPKNDGGPGEENPK